MGHRLDLRDGPKLGGAGRTRLVAILLLLPLYFLSAKLGLLLPLENPSATPVWPPTGIAIAALVVLGFRVWPLILVGAFVVNITTAGNVASSVGIAIGNTAEGLLGAYLVQRYANGRHAFDRPLDAGKFILLAATVSTALSPTIGVTSLAASGFVAWEGYTTVWRTWWLGDATGALIVAPPIIVWAAHRVIKWNPAKAIESCVLFIVTALAGVGVFCSTQTIENAPFEQAFLCLPAVVWIAFRFYPRVATAATLLLGSIVLFGTLADRGPFATYSLETSLLVAQSFTGVVAITTLVLSAATYERTHAEHTIRESETRFRTLADSSPSMIWVTDAGARCTFLNKTWLDFTGRGLEQDLGIGWIESVHPDDADRLVRHYRATFAERKDFKADFRLRRSDGAYRWVMSTGNPRYLADGTYAGYVGTCIDISERKRFEEELQQEALHDPLTGLPNRSLFLDRLGQSLRASKRRSARSHALLYLDIDRFKLINDTLGHGVGDDFLVETGRRIQTVLRPGDTVARLAGDEFAVLLADVDDLRSAERVSVRIEELFQDPFVMGGEEFFASASIGITLIEPKHVRPEDVLKDADSAMYRAKSLGRKRHQVYEVDAHKPVVEILRLEAELRRTLEADGLDVFYQPIVSLQEGAIVGFEALVRWRHADRGLLLPAEFISVAEQTGLIIELDRQVLRKACLKMRQWLDTRPETRRCCVSVNISPTSFSGTDVAETVAGALEESGIDGTLLRLEVTESVFIVNKDSVVAALDRLRELGVRVALDDFGTGYSSLGSLRDVPIDSLKIDRSFVAQLDAIGNNGLIVRSIVGLAHELGLTVTAEGVETEAELSAVRELQCDFVQGHYFGAPTAEPDMRAILV